MQERINRYTELLKNLLSAKSFSFDHKLRAALPNKPGIYRISEHGANWDSSLRIGRTKSAQKGLQQRVYQNHYMGDQTGNIKAQLVVARRFNTQDEAKAYLRNSCEVQFIIVADESERKWLEHFIISVLQPQFSD
jgi:excinuclease UvrABC nuclease subunit